MPEVESDPRTRSAALADDRADGVPIVRREDFSDVTYLLEIEHPLMRKIRYMDKLVDELAKGRPMEKILRA